MPFKVISTSDFFLEKELNDFAKNHIIKNYETHYDSSNNKSVVIIEWMSKKDERVEKLDNILSDYTPSMVLWIEKMFEHSFKKQWYETYWAIDIHGTILEPNHRKLQNETNFYPYAKETLQLLTKRKDIKLIMSTSSYPEEIEFYEKEFKDLGIVFDYINENPEIDSTKGNFGYYIDKYYVNVVFEDKAGFIPEKDWKPIYDLLKRYQDTGYLPNSKWSTKF